MAFQSIFPVKGIPNLNGSINSHMIVIIKTEAINLVNSNSPWLPFSTHDVLLSDWIEFVRKSREAKMHNFDFSAYDRFIMSFFHSFRTSDIATLDVSGLQRKKKIGIQFLLFSYLDITNHMPFETMELSSFLVYAFVLPLCICRFSFRQKTGR